MNVADFLLLEAQKPFHWGQTDCISTVDRWIWLNKGFSPLADLGICYSSQLVADKLLADRGGFALAISKSMKLYGFETTDAPKQGDVAVVIHNDLACLGIHTGQLYFSRHESGMIGASLNSVWKAWEL